MCGRYSYDDKKFVDLQWTGFQKIATPYGSVVAPTYKVKPNYNVAPSQTMPVFVPSKQADVQLELLQWGIDRQIGADKRLHIINTRAEKAFERFWSNIVLHERCLIPATSFFEWKTTPTGKKPFVIKPKNGRPFMFAGIYHNGTYSIMTTEPNAEMSQIHNRMPVILHEDDYERWIAGTSNRNDLEPILAPYEDGGLEIYEVGTAVNNVRNNTPEILQPIN